MLQASEESRLNELAIQVGYAWRHDLTEFIQGKSDDPLSALSDCMNGHLQRLAESNAWGPTNRLASSRLWQIVGSQLRSGSLQLHAREKPLGYAGDYTLLERICQNDSRGSGAGELFDQYFQRHAAPRAVRNRADLLAGLIVAHVRERSSHGPATNAYHIVSYGSGPAFELRLAFSRLTAEERACLSITLLDLDSNALTFATDRLTEYSPSTRITATRVNLSRLVKQSTSHQPFPPADFVFAAGYFDYLERTTAAKAIRFFWNRLHPGGQLCVFNFGEHNPSRAYMEWVANWYLIHRSNDDMQALATDSELPDDCWEVAIEPAGVNRYLTATKPS